MGRISPSRQNQFGKEKPQQEETLYSPPKPRQSRYRSGKAGGVGQFDPKEIDFSRESRQAGSSNKRDRGSQNKNQEPVKQKPIGTVGRTRYSGGVKAASVAADTPDVPVRPSQPSGWATDKTQLDALLSSGGSDTRVSPTGVVQTGTNTGFKPMTLAGLQAEDGILGKLGLKVADPYSSNQLPTTGSSPYQADSKPVAFNVPSGERPTGAKQQQLSNNLFESGGALDFEVPAEGKSVLSNEKDAKMARRRAFLDAEDSMAGLRAVEAQKGMVYAGGKHHILNPNRDQEGENDFFEITKDQARGYKSGRIDAQGLLSTYVGNGGAKPDAQLDSNGFTTPETNMLTLKDGNQKLMSDMTEDDWNM